MTEDGLVTSLNRENALRFIPKNSDPDDEVIQSTIEPCSLAEVITTAQQMGLEETDLRNLRNQLCGKGSPLRRKAPLIGAARKFNIKPEQALLLVRRYTAERIKETEKGMLFHYHQTGFNLGEFVKEGGLLSYNLLKQKGKAPSSGGSRPDVVQMTRDRYDADGTLIQRGLTDKQLGYGNALVFVFKPDIMDLPEYDGIDTYPDLPSIPLSFVETILVEDDSEVEEKQDMLDFHDLDIQVMTKETWKQKTYENQEAQVQK